MKFLPTVDREKIRASTQESPAYGLDAVIVLGLFLLVGFGIDRFFGTMPVFMIVMTVLAAVGLFARFKYRYELEMDAHEAKRQAKLAGNGSEPRDEGSEAA